MHGRRSRGWEEIPRINHTGVYRDRSHDDPSDEIYDPEAVARFDLEISPESQDALSHDPRADVPARLTYRGETLDVAVHLRGEASFRTLAGKPSFKVDIDAVVPEQTLRGLGGLVLKNGVQDHTLLSECLSYELAAAMRVPAPRCNAALVWVNGAYFGAYVNVEAIDKRFLVRHFQTSKGNLYEEDGSDLVAGAAADFERKIHEERTDRTDLETLIDKIGDARMGSFAADVDDVLDVDGRLALRSRRAAFRALGWVLVQELPAQQLPAVQPPKNRPLSLSADGHGSNLSCAALTTGYAVRATRKWWSWPLPRSSLSL